MRSSLATALLLASAVLAPHALAVDACPDALYFEGRDRGATLDLGWTGAAHEIQFTGFSFGLELANCTGATKGSCGACDAKGLVRETDEQHQRCLDRPWQPCQQNADCAAVGAEGPCRLFTGPPAALSSGGTGVCAIGSVHGTVAGTVDVEQGQVNVDVPLTVQLYAGTMGVPCPRCVLDATERDELRGGRCDRGLRAGEPCDAQAAKRGRSMGATSLDCPPSPDALIGMLATATRPLTLTSGTRAKTLGATSPTCRTRAFGDKACLCDVCADDPRQPCQRDADCKGGVCGSDIGAASAPNSCADGICTALSPTEGACNAGPFDGRCGPLETFRQCTSHADCPAEGDVCRRRRRPCFPGNGIEGSTITAVGTADDSPSATKHPVLSALFCAPPTTSDGFNQVAGLPGPARLRLPGQLTFGAAP